MKHLAIALTVLATSLGCIYVNAKPQILPNVKLPGRPLLRPLFKPGVQHVTLSKPRAKCANCPNGCVCKEGECKDLNCLSVCHIDPPQPVIVNPMKTAKIYGSGDSQYIMRSGIRCYWNKNRSAWVGSYRSCGVGGCSTKMIIVKPGE